MTTAIERYALIGDTQTACLVADDGSIDWLCVPRFDGGACFAALLGDESNGHWSIGPASGARATRRRYRDGTLVLETEWDTPEGRVRLTDCMPIRDASIEVVRIVEGLSGRVPMTMEMTVRFDYGNVLPWVRAVDQGTTFVSGPYALRLATPVPLNGRDLRHTAEFEVVAGESIPFVLTGTASHLQFPEPSDAAASLERTSAFWSDWSAGFTYDGDWSELVLRSAITLKALTYAPTGGIIAAPTTSLPEWVGGVRNWDYRYCWLRDATFTIFSLTGAGFQQEAIAFRDWLLRAVAGDPAHLQIVYGAAGERRLDEFEISWLPGYLGSSPVRVGNAAYRQYQLDVYGEVLDALHQMRCFGVDEDPNSWAVQTAVLDFLESGWRAADEGIWEVRGGRRDFVHSKVMAWVGFDRAVRAIESFGLDGPTDRWRACRDDIHREVLERGYDSDRNTFTQSYGSTALDASTLMIPLVGFLPADDPRVAGTVDAVQRELVQDGLVHRYHSDEGVDGLPPGEGAFLPCSFWLADALGMLGRTAEARALFERLVGLTNDVGLLSEGYDPIRGRMLGNFPQAFSHVSLINTASNLSSRARPSVHRATGRDEVAEPLHAINLSRQGSHERLSCGRGTNER